MVENLKIAVIITAPDSEAFRLGCVVAEEMWDAGAEVRVRRAAMPPSDIRTAVGRRWAELVEELDDVPEADAADIGWADVVFFPGGTLSLDTVPRPRPMLDVALVR